MFPSLWESSLSEHYFFVFTFTLWLSSSVRVRGVRPDIILCFPLLLSVAVYDVVSDKH
jgi:hypothetical protein